MEHRSIQAPALPPTLASKIATEIDEVIDSVKMKMSPKGKEAALTVPTGVLKIMQPEILMFLDTPSHTRLSELNKEAKPGHQ